MVKRRRIKSSAIVLGTSIVAGSSATARIEIENHVLLFGRTAEAAAEAV